MAGAIARRVSGLSVVMSKSSDAKKKKLFSSGQMASGHLPLRRPDKCKNSTSVMQGMVWGEPELVQVYDFDVDHVRCTRCNDKMLWELQYGRMQPCVLLYL